MSLQSSRPGSALLGALKRWDEWPFRWVCAVFYGVGLPLTFAATAYGIDEWTMYPPDWLALFGPLLWFVTPALFPGLLLFNGAALLLGLLLHTVDSRIARVVLSSIFAIVWGISGVMWVQLLSVL